MAAFVIEGLQREESLILRSVDTLGARVTRSLSWLGQLSATSIFTVDTPNGVDEKVLLAEPGIKVVEGTFFHPFYFLPPLVPPNQLLAAALQLLPPQAFKALPQEAVANIAGEKLLEAGAFEDFNVRDMPFGAPDLALGPEVGRDAFERAGDLERIMELTQITVAQQATQGEGAIIAIVDSGVDNSVLPASNIVSSWGDEGTNPFQDAEGHGSMVAAIALRAAPKAQFIVAKPGTSPSGAMKSLGTLAALDYLAGQALTLGRPIIANQSWGIFGLKNLVLPCNVLITRTVRLLDERGLVMTSWATGNNRVLAGEFSISGYCMSSTKWSTAAGAVGRDLRPQPYSSLGGQCSPYQPTVSVPTFGVLPWGSGFRDFASQGGGTSSCAPQVSGILALLMASYPGRPFAEYRAALRASANNGAVGYPGVPYHPLTGAGLVQAQGALAAMPGIAYHPWLVAENLLPSSIPTLGQEAEILR